MDASSQTTSQTPAQWAVRWHGVVGAALLVFAVPVFHLTWHVVLGHTEPPITTRSQGPMPAVTVDELLDGSWMKEVDSHLREASPVTWQLRGTWNELLWRCGIVQNPKVHRGHDEWLFGGATVEPPVGQVDKLAPERRRVFARVRDLVREAGGELVVSLVPDKARIYADLAYANRVIGARKQPIYGRALQELRDLGIPVVDVEASMAASRAAMPNQLLYYERDTHWRPEGALVAAQAAAALIEGLPIASDLPPRRPAELGARMSVMSVGDLAAMVGLLTRDVRVGEDRMRTQPMSLLSAELAVDVEYYGIVMHDGGGTMDPMVENVDNEILVIGTSFSEANGARALALALGRPVRAVIGFGAPGLSALHQVRGELLAGTKAKVVVWEIIERGLSAPQWSTIRL